MTANPLPAFSALLDAWAAAIVANDAARIAEFMDRTGP